MKNKKIVVASGLLLALGVVGVVTYRKLKNSAALPPSSSSPDILQASSGGIATTTPTATATGGQRVSNYPEGTLLRQGTDEKVYIIDARGYRHWISTRNYFDRHGYSMSNVKSISASQMQAIPELSPLAGLLGITRN